MKIINYYGLVLLIATLLGIAFHLIVAPLPDWILRLNGCVMLITIIGICYSTFKIKHIKKSR